MDWFGGGFGQFGIRSLLNVDSSPPSGRPATITEDLLSNTGVAVRPQSGPLHSRGHSTVYRRTSRPSSPPRLAIDKCPQSPSARPPPVQQSQRRDNSVHPTPQQTQLATNIAPLGDVRQRHESRIPHPASRIPHPASRIPHPARALAQAEIERPRSGGDRPTPRTQARATTLPPTPSYAAGPQVWGGGPPRTGRGAPPNQRTPRGQSPTNRQHSNKAWRFTNPAR